MENISVFSFVFILQDTYTKQSFQQGRQKQMMNIGMCQHRRLMLCREAKNWSKEEDKEGIRVGFVSSSEICS